MTHALEGIPYTPYRSTRRKQPKKQTQFETPGVNEPTLEEKNGNQSPLKGINYTSYIPQSKQPSKSIDSDIALRAAKGGTSGLFGTYGEILDLLHTQPKEKLLPGQEALLKAEHELPDKYLPFLQDSDDFQHYSRLASSEDIKDIWGKAVGLGEPETVAQKLTERIPEWIAANIATGGIAPAKTAIKVVAKTIARGAVPSIVATASEEADIPAWAQGAATIAASILTHKVTGQSLKSINQETYKKAMDAVPRNANIEAKTIERTARHLRRQMLKGGGAPSENVVLDFSNKILEKMSGGRLSIEEITSLKRSLNEFIGLNELKKNPRARTLLKSLGRSMDKQLEVYGKNNPVFLKNWKDAQSGFKGMAEANVIENFLKRHQNWTGVGLGGFLLKSLLPSITGGQVAGAAATAKGIAITSALARNSGLRKLYFKFLQSVSRDLEKPAKFSLDKLNKGLEKEIPNFYEEYSQ